MANGVSNGQSGNDPAGNGGAGNGSAGVGGSSAGGRAAVLCSQITRQWLFPAVLLYAVIWLGFKLEAIHIYFILALVTAPVLLEEKILRINDSTIRAWKGLPEPASVELIADLTERIKALECACKCANGATP